jgi:MerR family transcriptional regulator, redox-sensitive transcriptional activator SoxR
MPLPAGFLSIGEVSQQAGLRPSALRYYESMGHLPVPLRQSGQRRYDASVFKHFRLIQAAQKVGLSIEEIKTLLDSSETAPPYAERLQGLARRKLVEVSISSFAGRPMRGPDLREGRSG